MIVRLVRRFVFGVVCCAALVAPLFLSPVAAQAQPVRIIFMHHSTGAGLIAQGGVREGFTALGYEFWDHGYNDDGLVDAEGNWLGVNWDMPGDNTDPDGWRDIFAQPVTSPPTNTFSHMLDFDVIVFKSCFPTSNIADEAMLRDYEGYYLSIRDAVDQHPDRLFIAFTPPPLVPNETTLDNAARARRWAAYLTSDEFLAGHSNLVVFDFYSLLADADGTLRAEYRSDEWDSHPNERANAAIGPVFVEFVDQAVRAFEPGSAPAPQIEVQDEESGPSVSAWNDVLADFEFDALPDTWWTYANEPVTQFDCALASPGADSAGALALSFTIPTGGNAGCGFDLETTDWWEGTTGLSFSWRADAPGLALRVALFYNCLKGILRCQRLFQPVS